eukprot:scaffold647_cov411-Prasinococcus_capsulatus_cf.AAC.26
MSIHGVSYLVPADAEPVGRRQSTNPNPLAEYADVILPPDALPALPRACEIPRSIYRYWMLKSAQPRHHACNSPAATPRGRRGGQGRAATPTNPVRGGPGGPLGGSRA